MTPARMSFLRRGRRLTGMLAGFAVAILLALSAGACSSFAGPLNALFIPDDGYRLEEGIGYGPDTRQKLDVYIPVEASGKREVAVFFYGGSWKSGDRADYRFIGEAFTSRGFVTVIPDYRLYPEVRFPAFVGDGAEATAWVQANIDAFGGDPERIFLVGHSAGGHIAAMLSVAPAFLREAKADPAAIRGFVGLAGPYAFDPDKYDSIRPVFQGPRTEMPSQPVAHVDGDEPPMLLLHGGDDSTVNASNMYALARDVSRADGTATALEVANTGHIGLLLSLAKPFREPGGVLDTIAAWMADPNCRPDGLLRDDLNACTAMSGA